MRAGSKSASCEVKHTIEKYADNFWQTESPSHSPVDKINLSLRRLLNSLN